jgi:uncharacterized protein (TIGR00369 family)
MSIPSNLPASDLLFGADIPLARTCGLIGEHIGGDRATVRLPYNPAFTNSRGDVHGGILTALFDTALSCAVRSHDPLQHGVVTIDLSTHFLAACAGDVVVQAHCERRGRTLCFARGEAHNNEGRLLALATGTFKLVARTHLPTFHD